MKIKLLGLCLFFTFAFSYFTRTTGVETPLTNPGFEEGQGGFIIPGYRTHSAKTNLARFFVAEDVHHSGNQSIGIERTDPSDASATTIWASTQTIPVVPGLTYTAEVMAKCDQVLGRVNLAIRFKDKNGSWSDTESIIHGMPIGGTTDWIKITVSTVAPVSVGFMEIFLGGSFTGKVWFDDLKLTDNRDILEQQLSEIDQALQNAGKYSIDTAAQLASLKNIQSPIKEYIKSQSASRDFSEPLEKLKADVESLKYRISFLKAEKDMNGVFHISRPEYAVGWLSSMQRVFLKESPFPDRISQEHTLDVFQGENESFQLAITPFRKKLKSVKISLSDLPGKQGAIPREAISIRPVGYVFVEKEYSPSLFYHEQRFVGWWPDPLVENFDFAVEQNTVQPVWIKIKMPRDIPAGIYQGTISIAPENAEKLDLILKVNVWPVSVPEHTRLKTIISFDDNKARNVYTYQWNDALYKKYIDFILAQRIALAGLYQIYSPRLMKYCAAQGQNIFLADLVGFHFDPKFKPDGISREQADQYVNKIKQQAEILRQEGLLEKTYIYGFDERWPTDFPLMNYLFGRIKQEAGIPGLTTAYDSGYGSGSGMDGVAGWIPKLPRYNPVLAEKARENGKEVWTYLINWELEQPAIKSRLLGWMIYKYDIDGLLYWLMNNWAGNSIIKPSRTVKTDWTIKGGVIPSSCGLLIYPGSKGPLSSIRFENLADGIEDYDLLMKLKSALVTLPNSGSSAESDMNRIRDAAKIGDDLIVDGVRNYTLDPENIYQKRRKIAEAFMLIDGRK